jgi:hypothetical protein
MRVKTKVISREKVDMLPPKEESLVDRAFKLDIEIKEKVKELEEMKAELKIQAEIDKKHEMLGNYGKALFTDTVEWDINEELLIKWLKTNKKKELTFVIFKPAVGEIRKYLGEDAFKDFAKKNTKSYNKLSLKKR